MSRLHLIIRIFSVVPPKDRPRGLMVLAVVCFSALFQIVGILSVAPFLVVLSDPELIANNERLGWIYDAMGFQTVLSFQIFLGAASFGAIIFASILRIATFYAQTKFVQSQRFALSTRLLRGYLAQPYPFFLEHKTSDLIKTLLGEANMFINQALVPASTIISSALQIIVLIIMLIVVDPWVAGISTLLIVGAFGTVYFLVQPNLLKLGKIRHQAEAARTQSAVEAMFGAKAIKLTGRELQFVEAFEAPSREANRANIRSAAVSQIPRHIIEAIGFGGMVLLALYLVIQSNAQGTPLGQTVVPVLVIYAFAGYRLLPAFQSLYNSFATLRFMNANVHDVLDQVARIGLTDQLSAPAEPMAFRETLKLDRVCFSYDGASGKHLNDITLTVPANTSLGIVGRSGSGKTTLVDVILGLLVPSSGQLLIDGTHLDHDHRRSWQRTIGYVPQDIFVTGRSVAENIAFGVPSNEIDMEQVMKCAKIAQIHDFVSTELDQGYQTEIGDRGARVSGGQRQRIGIARALYFDPSVIVFDEATSALDNVTEIAVMRAIDLMRQTKTVILVAHRLSTIQSCDQIAVLENGRLAGLGQYAELTASNPTFRALLSELPEPDADVPKSV